MPRKRCQAKSVAWILQKLKLVSREPQGDIVAGTRILYLGKRYYTRLIRDSAVPLAAVVFNYSSFKVSLNPSCPHPQEAIMDAFDTFYRQKAAEKIQPRVRHWGRITGLVPADLKFRKLSKRWGSCTGSNAVIINIYAVKLPFSLLDYIVVHELCHLKHKSHTRAFWKEVETYLPSYRELEDQISLIRS